MNIDLSKIAKKLMLDEPFYGLFLLTLNKRENTQIPTACVSLQGINQSLEINPEYWNSLPELQRIGLLKHELLHIMFHHFLLDTTMYPDAKLRNIAADIEINQFIDEQNKSKEWLGLTSVPNLVLPEKAGTRVYYDMIKDKASTCPQVQEWLDGLGDNSDEFADGHEMWGDPNMDEATKKLIGKQLEHQVKEIAEHLDKKGSKFRGTLPGTLVEWIDSLFELPVPVTDWKSYFKRFISSSDKVVTKKSVADALNKGKVVLDKATEVANAIASADAKPSEVSEKPLDASEIVAEKPQPTKSNKTLLYVGIGAIVLVAVFIGYKKFYGKNKS